MRTFREPGERMRSFTTSQATAPKRLRTKSVIWRESDTPRRRRLCTSCAPEPTEYVTRRTCSPPQMPKSTIAGCEVNYVRLAETGEQRNVARTLANFPWNTLCDCHLVSDTSCFLSSRTTSTTVSPDDRT